MKFFIRINENANNPLKLIVYPLFPFFSTPRLQRNEKWSKKYVRVKKAYTPVDGKKNDTRKNVHKLLSEKKSTFQRKDLLSLVRKKGRKKSWPTKGIDINFFSLFCFSRILEDIITIFFFSRKKSNRKSLTTLVEILINFSAFTVDGR